jgi:hypothetical protein
VEVTGRQRIAQAGVTTGLITRLTGQQDSGRSSTGAGRIQKDNLSRQGAIYEAVAEGSQGQFGSARHVQLAKDMVEILFHSAFT